MRLFVCGSAPLPAQILEEFRELFGHTILERYGMTETLITLSTRVDGERRPGWVGVPVGGTITRPSCVRTPTIFPSRRPVNQRLSAGPTERV